MPHLSFQDHQVTNSFQHQKLGQIPLSHLTVALILILILIFQLLLTNRDLIHGPNLINHQLSLFINRLIKFIGLQLIKPQAILPIKFQAHRAMNHLPPVCIHP